MEAMLLIGAGLLAATMAMGAANEPLRLHPDNPHYFLFRGEPTIVITSGEHYGAVLNLDFDYVKYLDTMKREGMNNSRMFVGAYCEAPGDFTIAANTLAPAEGRFICPWARSDQPGYANGGNKFDLTRWDEAYFARLKDFVGQASRRGIIVEVNLFCPFYGDSMWNLSPMKASNNINGVGDVGREAVYTTDPGNALLPVQEAMARKVVTELRDYDNLYFEVMNEPYCGPIPLDWQLHLAKVVADAEEGLAHRHLISRNVANHRARVESPHPAEGIYNFHYAWLPDTVAMNYDLNRVIGDNETGFAGTAPLHYRKEAWAFIVAGGGLYNNLDYSFTVGHEDGTFEYPETQPGSGGVELRRQLRLLGRFIRAFDFIAMRPMPEVVQGALPEGVAVQVLAEAGRQYAVYVCAVDDAATVGAIELSLDLPKGEYTAEWVDPLTGGVALREKFSHTGGQRKLVSPDIAQDMALRIHGGG